jgi:hypothetical protein
MWLKISLLLILFAGLLFAEEPEKDTRIISQGKSFMTDFVTCIKVCKEFQNKDIPCKCDVYTESQMKILKENQK